MLLSKRTVEKILNPIVNQFISVATTKIILDKKTKIGGSIQVGLLRKLIDVSHHRQQNDGVSVSKFNFGKHVYTKDPQFASRTFNVYTTTINGKLKVYILHSSTNPASMEDMIADIGLIINVKTKRITDNVKLQIEAENKYLPQTNDITTVGYSLGSFVAEEASEAGSKSKEIFIVSRPITFLNIDRALGKNVFSVKSPYDPVGLLWMLTKELNKEIMKGPKGGFPGIKEFWREHLSDTVLSRFDQHEEIGNMKEEKEEEVVEEEQKLGKGLSKEKWNKRRVADLKSDVKRLRKEKKVKVKDYPLVGKNKKQLIEMIKELDEM